jgi:hypothetical protein
MIQELWNEQNVRGFQHKSSPTFVIFDKIKREARLVMLAGAKHLGDFILGEYVFISFNRSHSLVCFFLINRLGQNFCPCFKNKEIEMALESRWRNRERLRRRPRASDFHRKRS